MSDKRNNNGFKRKNDASRKTVRPPTNVHLEIAFQRAVTSVQKMTQQQRRRSLIKAGILTPEGKLGPNYS